MRRIIKKFTVASIFVLFLLSIFIPNSTSESGGTQFDLDDFMQQVLEEHEADTNITELPYREYIFEQKYDVNYTDYIPGEVIVAFKPEIDVSEIETFEGHNIIDKIEILNVALIEVEEDYELDFIDYLEQRDDVYFAELDTMLWAMWEPNDEYWDDQWGPEIIECPSAWDTEKGNSDIFIAIIDTGVDFEHEDHAVSQHYGWDFVNDDNNAQDDHGHGTQCAGIAAAHMNNEIGIAGVSEAGIMGVKVLNFAGWTAGRCYNVAKGIMYAASQDQVWIISMSLGWYHPSPLLRAACLYAYIIKNDLIVAAAGNHFNPGDRETVMVPARYQSVVAVAAIDKYRNVCDFSNYGDEVELAAPGKEIITTDLDDDYNEAAFGTSMAAPHVAGVAHLYYSKQLRDDSSYKKNFIHLTLCREKLQKSADDISPPNWDKWTGWGLVQANDMLTKNIVYTKVIGNGYVSYSPNQNLYEFNSVVQLTANPSSGSVFDGWSGDLSSLDSHINVTVNGDKYLVATFSEQT